MANLQVATDFEKIINADRDRKKNEALAARIFNRDRRASGGPATARLGGSLASRVGVKKRGIPTGPRSQVAATAGDINGEWTHDLHDRHSAPSTPRASPRPGSLASRITNPLAGPARQQPQPQRRAAQVAQALIRSERQVRPSASLPALGGGGFNKGITIRGLAGPFVVMAQNFAPGTTAADIENAMTPVGGVVSSCRLLKSSPIVIAEIVFESKEGADNIIATFNNQVADGRVLHVYHKLGGAAAPTAPARRPSPNPPTGPRAQRNDGVVDGSMGFDDPMDGMDDGRSGRSGGVGPAYANGDRDGNVPRGRGQGGLYSDNLVPGRGGGGGGGGGGGRWTRR